jgi:hypothetical protein
VREQPGWLKIGLTMLGIIALYLILVYSGGAAKILAAVQSVVVNETFALQGGFQGPAAYAKGTP